MPKVMTRKVGMVYLKEIAPNRWRASWTDPTTKKHMRRLLPAATFGQAVDEAKPINKALAEGHGWDHKMRGGSGVPITDAIIESIKHSDANERTRKEYASLASAFTGYLGEYMPGIQGWGQVTEQILQNFIEHSRRSGFAPITIKHRLAVLRLASRHMARTYPNEFRDVTAGVRFKIAAPSRSEIEAKSAVLSPVQLRALLDWLRENEPMVHVWAVVQGLTGARMFEAAYLREQDIDAARRTIAITESDAKAPKNRHSYREIPVAPAVVEALGGWIRGLTVRHGRGYLFFPSRAPGGRAGAKSREARAGAFSQDTIKHLWARALNRARVEGIDLPAAFMPRKLRATFVSLMRGARADFADLQAYIGHRPATTLSAHYDEGSMERLAAVARLAQGLAEGSGAFAEIDPETAAKTAPDLH